LYVKNSTDEIMYHWLKCRFVEFRKIFSVFQKNRRSKPQFERFTHKSFLWDDSEGQRLRTEIKHEELLFKKCQSQEKQSLRYYSLKAKKTG